MKNSSLDYWLEELVIQAPSFVKTLKNKKIDGSYNLAINGAINSSKDFGLGYTSFAIRINKICNSLKDINVESTKNYLLSFKNNDCYFVDKYLAKKTFIIRTLRAMKNRDLRFISNSYTKLAETRQTLAALMNLDIDVINFIPRDFLVLDYKKFLSSLNWNKPWSSCSYINHFLFLNNYLLSDESEKDKNNKLLVKFLLDKQNDIRSFGNKNLKDHMQFTGSTMKILMALSIINKESLIINDNLIDNLLIRRLTKDACEEVNLAFCLSSCLNHSDYRYKDIRNFLYELLQRWKDLYFFEKFGGFSFYHNRSQQYYYDAKVSLGLNLPDMHGTAMFIMGIEKVLKAVKHKKSKLFKFCYL